MRTPRPIHATLALSALGFSALAFLGVAAPASAATSSPEAPAVPAVASDTSDFTFDSFDAVYELSRDDEGRSLMTTTETLVAVFPPDQNRGILRDIPTEYRGHTTQVHVVSVTDESGRSRDYESSFESNSGGSYIELAIGVEDGEFAPAGPNTYVITYTQKDVTLDPDDSTADEFFWDVNGTGWQQPFGRVSATLNVDADLAGELNGDSACYYGPEGSTSACEIVENADGSFTASTSELPPHSNMTIAVGFAPDTFSPARFDLGYYVSPGTIAGLVAAIAALIAALVVRVTRLRDAPGTGIVVAQYEAPEGVGVFLAANITGTTKRAMGSAMVDLAVRRKLRILERPEEGLFASGSTFGVQYVDNSGLIAADDAVMSALFTSAPDGLRWLTKKDTELGTKVVALTKAAATEAVTRGYRRKPRSLPTLIIAVIGLISVIVLFVAGVQSDSPAGAAIGVGGAIAMAVLGLGALGVIAGRRPLTREGALLKEHLDGLKEFIRLAEADRLRMLQSITGAERTSGDGGSQVVKVYELLLPYAILFGQETEWAAELAKFYDTTPPDWYDGSSIGAFQVGAFAASMGSLSSTASSSYSGSASSSSSGGSSGGGSSGGGGGGGGGGGF